MAVESALANLVNLRREGSYLRRCLLSLDSGDSTVV